MKFLLIKDVQRIFNYDSYESARTKVQLVKDAYDIKGRRITLDEFCTFFDLNKEKVSNELNFKKQ